MTGWIRSAGPIDRRTPGELTSPSIVMTTVDDGESRKKRRRWRSRCEHLTRDRTALLGLALGLALGLPVMPHSCLMLLTG